MKNHLFMLCEGHGPYVFFYGGCVFIMFKGLVMKFRSLIYGKIEFNA